MSQQHTAAVVHVHHGQPVTVRLFPAEARAVVLLGADPIEVVLFLSAGELDRLARALTTARNDLHASIRSRTDAGGTP
jgi:hypothetical protein